MASRAQILAYYELVLADLKVTLINFNIANIIITIMGNPEVGLKVTVKDFKFMGIVHFTLGKGGLQKKALFHSLLL